MALVIIRNDITKVAADAIVNTANPLPIVGAGTDTAIHRAAGPELLEARKQIGEIAPGRCAATPAFGLPARFVLHAVGKTWNGGGEREKETLRSAYDAALELADRLGCRSIAAPLMGTGCYGFPRDLALSVAIQAFTDFLMDHDVTIYLVLFGEESFGLAGSLFGDLKSYIDDRYVEEQKVKEYGRDYRSRYARREPLRPQRAPGTVGANSAQAYPVNCDTDAVASCSSEVFSEAASGEPDEDVSLPDYLDQSESTFSEYLRDLLRERSGKDSEVYKRAEISRQLFSKILNDGAYQPRKNTVIQLAIGLQLDVNQTQKLLERAGYTLTRSSKTDLAVQYFIERKIYSVTFINEALYDSGLPLLTTGLTN